MSDRRTRTARREWPCAYGRDTILPGERYVDEVHPPWTLVYDDPDSAGEPLGTWQHDRYHDRCLGELMYG